MPQDDSILARIRRNGYAGTAAQEAQEYDDAMANGGGTWGAAKHGDYDDVAEKSVQDHVQQQRSSTGGAGTDQSNQ